MKANSSHSPATPLLGFLAAVLFALGIVVPRPAAASGQEAAQFLETLSRQAVEELQNEDLPVEKREQRFRELLNEAFDIQAISQFVLGRYWRVASEEEKQRFIQVLEDVVVQRFMPFFTDYEGEGVAVRQTIVDEKNNLITVITTTEFNGEQVRLDWRLRPRGDSYKIVDVVAEGASLVITYRSEYGAFIKQNGGRVTALIDDLQAKVDRGAFKPADSDIQSSNS
jgi:phospholipid transport system substrate-binding protein